MKYEFGIASYPTGFIGCVVSPTKICLQYSGVDVKFRPLGKSTDNLPKGSAGRYLPITVSPNTIETLATGSQMPVLEQMHLGLLDAYEEYIKTHYETYSRTYDKKFVDHLKQVQIKVNRLVGMAINVEQGIDNK